MGGENDCTDPNILLMPGSSPRGRGKHATRDDAYNAAGLIPAWAGKTDRLIEKGRHMPAHPRVGGENLDNRERAGDHAGSSPRGRGKPKILGLGDY